MSVRSIHIALVNNMSGSALEATERQFRALLAEAAGKIPVRLSLYSLPDVPRPDEDTGYIKRVYCDIRGLWKSRLDGLIVTGAEPLTSNLMDEPYWENLKTLIEWAEHNTYSSIWSCLAAHAAVLRIDGIRRRPLGSKLFGVFECDRLAKDPVTSKLTTGIPDRLLVPHSRWNGLAESALAACGYQMLTRSQDAGVDAFVKLRKSLFVFFQGHPEYDADTLLLEYRRDIRRFLQRERSAYPLMPEGYFSEEQTFALGTLRERALFCGGADHSDRLLADFPVGPVSATLKSRWRSGAVGIYRNWIRYLMERKAAHRNGPPYVGMGRMAFDPLRPVSNSLLNR